MDIVLLSEVIKEQDLWAYPYNALRNQALARADTDVSDPATHGYIHLAVVADAGHTRFNLRRACCLSLSFVYPEVHVW